jgi:hypothetical protein
LIFAEPAKMLDYLMEGRVYLMKADMDESATHSEAWAYTTT